MVIVNVGERSVVWCGEVHVRFLGLGHTLMVVIVSAFKVVEYGRNRNRNNSSGNMIVFVVFYCFEDRVIEWLYMS